MADDGEEQNAGGAVGSPGGVDAEAAAANAELAGVEEKEKDPIRKPRNTNAPVLKVALVGPKVSGKTRIANHLCGVVVPDELLAQAQKEPLLLYEPTVGTRILEFDREILARSRDGKKAMNVAVQVELWDCSGDQKYEPCWPAIMKDLTGLVVVFDPTSKAQANEVRVWCEWFCKNAELENEQSVIFAHGMLNTQNRPFIVNAGKRKVVVPIVNVNLQPRQGGMAPTPTHGAGQANPALVASDNIEKNPNLSAPGQGNAAAAAARKTSADSEFNKFLGGLYAFLPKADFSNAQTVIPNIATSGGAKSEASPFH